ncbi:sigma-70 family RNA polymerase sigma factor [Lacrimispora amygdalina]|uniref:Sigma-70 family RNA polymerase sigma factor n=1 Tax=Lacrimispora amygdalina TaxID=253257 RepID=A0A3E2N9C1_9FIRM|nr:sigma-70 family RNA polymerase sigma factor [Clostridium indicum]RFZ77615.1 sigma-70 family RNA polymerase sigma factor [Clostridium indicum]
MQKNMKLTMKQQCLVESNLSIVHWVIVKNIHVNCTILGMSYEDLYQEGCIWLCKAASSYDPSLSLFPTYAKKVIRNGLISYCRRRCDKEKHFVYLDVGDNGELLQGAIERSTMDGSAFDISFLETLDLLDSRKAAYHGVARLGIEALALKIRGYSITEIAALYDVPPSHVGAWISRSAQKLRNDPAFLAGLY